MNPFVGLRPFERADSLFYFGRGEQVQALLELLSKARFLAVVGSSGCGKSSLVRAGLIPALESGFLVQDRDRWRIVALKPGTAPVQHLAEAILQLAGAPASSDPPLVREDLAAGPTHRLTQRLYEEGADAAVDLIERAGGAQTNVLLLIDQFEELFRFGLRSDNPQARDAAETFSALLLRLADQQRLPLYICLTMRSDFLGDCDAFIWLPEAINRGQFLVPRLTRTQRRQAIEGPVRLAGGQIAPRLVDRLLNENVGTRDDLPILQHLLMRLWDTWAAGPDGPIDLVHYEQVHTLQHALDRHAEEALEELSEADRTLARRLFQTLTELDPGNRGIRRPAHLSEVMAITEAPVERVMRVIDCFLSQRRNFLVLSSEHPVDDPLIDISHESLIRQWQTLRAWVDEEDAAAKIYRRLAETAVLYEEGKAELYWDADLKQCLLWKRRFRPNRSWALRYAGDFNRALEFLRESRLVRCTSKKEKARAKAEREQLLKERAHLAEQRAEQERAARKRARRWTATMTVFALLLLMGFGLLLFLYKEGVPLRYVFSVAQEWVLYRLGASHLKEPKMLRVPPGGLPQEFQMGAEDGTGDEQPVHPVRIARPYAIGQFEVTFEEYDAFAKKAGFSAPSDWGWGRRRQPVVNVSWEDARRYAQWLSWVTGKAYRLPTESEWEYAARAGTRTAYWWGGAIRQNGEVWANCAKCGSNWDGIRPAPVGSFPPNLFGLYDTAGNTWEWVQDCWHDNYLGAPGDGAAWLQADDGECGRRVVRGGSWFVEPSAVRSANRYRFDSDYRVHNVGFRLAQDI